MALNIAYATAAEYRSRISPDKDNSDDANILEDLTAMSRYLDYRLSRVETGFGKDDTEQTRLFVVGNEDDRYVAERIFVPSLNTVDLDVDEMSEAPTSILLDQDRDGVFELTLNPSEYELMPRNAPQMPEPMPFTTIRLLWKSHRIFLGLTRVEVTARFGWPAIPPAIKLGTIQLTALLRLETPRASRRIPEDIGAAVETSYSAQRIVQDLVDQYGKPWVLM